MLSPPVTLSHSVSLQLGHGGNESIEPASIVWPQFVHLYVPADTSLPVGTGSAISPSHSGYRQRLPDVNSFNRRAALYRGRMRGGKRPHRTRFWPTCFYSASPGPGAESAEKTTRV
jgi:hypothetical protein